MSESLQRRERAEGESLMLFSEKKRPLSQTYISTAEGESITGYHTKFGDNEYVLARDEEGNYTKLLDYDSLSEVDDGDVRQRVLQDVQRMIRENHEIDSARKQHAVELADGDEILEDILFMNMGYRDGDVDSPVNKNGIDFYPVGQNASHSFYAGTKDGKRYVYSIGESGWDDETNMPIIKDDIREVEAWGYLGHY